ncbi:hypothetical protein D3C84_754940 [compost metagenome]
MNDYKFELMHIIDVCLLLGITAGEVRKLCREGKIVCTKRQYPSMHYDIPTSQFRNHPNWNGFLIKREERRQRNVEFCKGMLELWSLNEEETK